VRPDFFLEAVEVIVYGPEERLRRLSPTIIKGGQGRILTALRIPLNTKIITEKADTCGEIRLEANIKAYREKVKEIIRKIYRKIGDEE